MRGLTIPTLLACSFVSTLAVAQEIVPSSAAARGPKKQSPSSSAQSPQDFTQTVVPITAVKLSASVKFNRSGKLGPSIDVDAGFGTGFCLDPQCGFIVTNYHLAATMKPAKVKGEKIIQRYFATGPNDEGATPNFIPNRGVIPYATKRDLAVYQLKQPLRRHHGLSFNLDELEVGQAVDIYGYPKRVINPIRSLVRVSATFKGETTSGLLAFDYEPGNEPIRGGSSGGIVVDRRTGSIIAVLCGTNNTTAVAVPAETLADFIGKINPFLAQSLFPSGKQIPPMSQDFYTKFVPPPHSDVLQHRPEEPEPIRILRQKGQNLAAAIRNFVAVQSFAWGSGDNEPSEEAAYEVRVIQGHQTFRRFPDGDEEWREVPPPHRRTWVTAADEWSDLPTMIGTDPKLKIQEAPDVIYKGQRLKVFQYYASVEDNQCPFQPVGFWGTGRILAVACYGEVWTDEDLNIIRISQRMDLSDKLKEYHGWKDHGAVITYAPLKLPNEPPSLVPVTIYVEAHTGKRIYWCRGHFTDYRVFKTESKLLADSVR